MLKSAKTPLQHHGHKIQESRIAGLFRTRSEKRHVYEGLCGPCPPRAPRPFQLPACAENEPCISSSLRSTSHKSKRNLSASVKRTVNTGRRSYRHQPDGEDELRSRLLELTKPFKSATVEQI